jgi:hypothetical protein
MIENADAGYVVGVRSSHIFLVMDVRVPVTRSMQVIVTGLIVKVVSVTHVFAGVIVEMTCIVPGSVNARIMVPEMSKGVTARNESTVRSNV